MNRTKRSKIKIENSILFPFKIWKKYGFGCTMQIWNEIRRFQGEFNPCQFLTTRESNTDNSVGEGQPIK